MLECPRIPLVHVSQYFTLYEREGTCQRWKYPSAPDAQSAQILARDTADVPAETSTFPSLEKRKAVTARECAEREWASLNEGR